MTGGAHEAWIIAAAGEDTSRRFHVPGDSDGARFDAWVELRPLTARQALQRESLGLREEYQLGPDGTPVAMGRTYDHEAMEQFEVQCCVIDYQLPLRDESGATILVGPEELPVAELLDRLPVALMAWLHECLDEINMRSAGGAAVLAEGKGG